MKRIQALELVNENGKKSHKYEPPEDLRRFVEVLLSEEVKGNKVKAESITHVSRGKFYWHYRKHSEFREWISDQCDLLLGRYEGIAVFSLLGALLKNDVQAIRTYYELRGKLKHIVKNESAMVEVKVPTVINFIAVYRDKDGNDRVIEPGSIEHRDSAPDEQGKSG